MRRLSKTHQANRQRFKAEVIRWLQSVGAVRGDFYDYRLDTALGLLHVTPYDDWVACRWDDVPRALARIGPAGMNRYSGKWNFHFPDACFQTAQAALEAARVFADCLRPYLPEVLSPVEGVALPGGQP